MLALSRLQKMFNADQLKYSRSRGATRTLRDVAVRPFSNDGPAAKRTDREAGLQPEQKIPETQPTSSESFQERHTVRLSFEDSIDQPRVVLGTPLPPTQQSSGLFRALAPSPPVQRTTHPIVSLSDPATIRSSTTSVDHAYLATRYRKGGKDSQDNPSTAGARVKLAAIQRGHRSRRRAGETVSLTPTISQLDVCKSETAGEGICTCAEICTRVYRLSREHRCESESRSTTDRWHSNRRHAIEGRRRHWPVLGVRYRR
jgi:hypothetical protein